jgi:transposase-like protein
MSVLSKPYFHDEAAAFAHLGGILWPEGPVCPHCGSISGKHYDLRKTRVGLRKCSDCRKQFTVKVSTVFESAHIPLNKMLQAVYLMSSSKKGISAHQLHRVLEITYKSAWFLCHRIREAMRSSSLPPMGGEGSTIEADETYIGRVKGIPKRRGSSVHKNMVLALVERGGSARSFVVDGKAISDIKPIVRENVARESSINTDEAKHYYDVAKEFATHETVNHSKDEYVRYEGERLVTSNTVEGYFSVFKRGMKGVYQHCDEKHLHRYLAEFDFRYSNRVALGVDDKRRTEKALTGLTGKRLLYRDSSAA